MEDTKATTGGSSHRSWRLSPNAKPFVPSQPVSDGDSCLLPPFLAQGILVTNDIPVNHCADSGTSFIADYFSYNRSAIPKISNNESTVSNLIKLEIPKSSSSESLSDDDISVDSPCYIGRQYRTVNDFPKIPLRHVGETFAPLRVTVEKLEDDVNNLSCVVNLPSTSDKQGREELLRKVHGLSEKLLGTCRNADELSAEESMKLQIAIQNLEKIPEESRKGKSGIGVEDEKIQENMYKNLWINSEVENLKLKYELQNARTSEK